MSFRTTYILFGVLVGLIVLFSLSQMLGTKPGDETYVMSDMRDAKATADDIDTVEIDRVRPTEERLVFVLDKDAKRWKMTKPYPARADSDVLNQLVRSVVSARKEEKADVRAQLDKFGLKPPTAVVTLKQGSGREWTLNLGDESAGGTNALVYVTSSGQRKMAMAIKRSEIENLFKPVKDYRSKDLLARSGDLGSGVNIQALRIDETGHDPVVLDKGTDERWRIEKPPYGEAEYEGETPPGGDESKRVNGVRDLLTAVDNIRVESDDDFVANEVSDFSKYGLDTKKPERLKIEVKRKPPGNALEEHKEETPAVVLLVGKKADDKGDKYYARLESEANVVRVTAKSIEPIVKVAGNPAALRDRDLVDAQSFKIDAIDIKNAAGLVQLRKPETAWKLSEKGKLRGADDAAVQDLLTSLTTKRQIQSFPDPAKEKELGFEKPDATVVSLWVDGLEKPEKKDDDAENKEKKDEKKDEAEPKLKDPKPAVKLTFGKTENGSVYVRRETSRGKLLAAVPESVWGKVSQGPLAFLDRSIPAFAATGKVTQVTLDRNGEKFQIDREQKDDKSPVTWKIKLPKDLAGRAADPNAVERIIGDLRLLRADRLVNEHPAAAALADYGLKSPRYTVSLKVEDPSTKKSEEWTYAFGKESSGNTELYARQAQHELVFLVKPSVLDTLNSELLDPTVFHFDPAKIKQVKLTGWKQAVSFTFTLDLERKADKTWGVKTPPDFDLDAQEAENFVNGLANLRANRIVVRKTGPKPEHKLGPTDRLLRIELTVEGEKAPATLTIGALDTKERGYFAESSTAPGDVFVLPQDRFEKLLSGPKFFSKKAESAR